MPIEPTAGAFLEHRDLELAELFALLLALFDGQVVRLGELCQAIGAGEPRRPGADEQHVHVHRLAFDLGFGLPRRLVPGFASGENPLALLLGLRGLEA